MIQYGLQELSSVYANMCMSCFWCPLTLAPSLPGFSSLHWKKPKTIETQFGAVKKSFTWANGGSDTDLYSSKIPTGIQEDFCLSNISSLGTGDCPWPFKEGFQMDLL